MYQPLKRSVNQMDKFVHDLPRFETHKTVINADVSTGRIKEADNFETALNLAKLVEVWSFLLTYIYYNIVNFTYLL